MNEKKVYFHVDLDAFFASVEQREHPEYRGKPLIIGVPEPRNVVSTCSYEARKFGVHSAMPALQAYRLCPQGIFIPGNYSLYSKVSAQVMAIIAKYAPSMVQISIDEASLNMSGTERLFGKPRELALKMKEEVFKEVGITMSIGIGTNPFIAKMASDYNKPNGMCAVSPGKEMVFIDTIGLEKIWGLGKSSLETLRKKGLTTTKQIREYSEENLVAILGKSFGSYLFNACRGIDSGFMFHEAKTHSLSTETTFLEDVKDRNTLVQVLLGMSKELMFRSVDEKVMAKTVGLKLRWGEDFRTITVQITPEDPILNSDQIYNLGTKLLDSKWKPGQGIRLIGLGLYQTYAGDKPIQDSLFSTLDHKKRDLDKAVRKLGEKGLQLKKASQL
ncbi:MAG: DNA polymerase IV [Sphaerochaetaceae bacterium]|nr:DNA polymerase IV [Sphaerochaetaceae bacterium]